MSDEQLAKPIPAIKTRVVTLPQKLRQIAKSICAQEDLAMELEFLAHVADTLMEDRSATEYRVRELEQALKKICLQAMYAGMEDTPLYGIADAALSVADKAAQS